MTREIHALAKELLGYQQTIQLTPEQQAIYDKATTMTDMQGPCCCHCWRWTAFDGLGKYMISHLNWNAQQVAHLWDLLEGCGGPAEVSA